MLQIFSKPRIWSVCQDEAKIWGISFQDVRKIWAHPLYSKQEGTLAKISTFITKTFLATLKICRTNFLLIPFTRCMLTSWWTSWIPRVFFRPEVLRTFHGGPCRYRRERGRAHWLLIKAWIIIAPVRCPVSGVRCPVSGVRCPVSSVQCPMSGVWCPVSGGSLRIWLSIINAKS